MVELWIVLAVAAVVVVAVVAASAVTVRRRRTGAPPGTGPAPSAPPGAGRPPPGPPPAAPTAGPQLVQPEAAEVEPEAAVEVEAVEVEATEGESEAVAAPPSFRERLGKARGLFSGYLGAIRTKGSVDQETWDELEEALLRADVGVSTTDALLEDLRTRVSSKELVGPDAVLDALRVDLVRVLTEAGDRQLRFDQEEGVTNVWLFVGVNGVGKTTTLGKLARLQAAGGRSVVMAAGDTFRAAAAEQLAMWSDRSGAEIVRGAEGGDPSAVVFDAVRRASARGRDLVLADTAGRLHTKVNLVEELKKIRRVADRPPGRVTEVLLVLDATTGQNALVQARQFTEAVEVTGVALTKLDGTAKGGVVVAVQREIGVPVKLVGLGEGLDDLVAFDAEAFVEALLG